MNSLSTTASPILLFLIVNPSSRREIGTYIDNPDLPAWYVAELKTKVFDVVQRGPGDAKKRLKHDIDDNVVLFYTYMNNDIAYFVAVDKRNPFSREDTLVYELIEDVDNKGVKTLVDKEGKLKNAGKQNIKFSIDNYLVGFVDKTETNDNDHCEENKDESDDEDEDAEEEEEDEQKERKDSESNNDDSQRNAREEGNDTKKEEIQFGNERNKEGIVVAIEEGQLPNGRGEVVERSKEDFGGRQRKMKNTLNRIIMMICVFIVLMIGFSVVVYMFYV